MKPINKPAFIFTVTDDSMSPKEQKQLLKETVEVLKKEQAPYKFVTLKAKSVDNPFAFLVLGDKFEPLVKRILSNIGKRTYVYLTEDRQMSLKGETALEDKLYQLVQCEEQQAKDRAQYIFDALNDVYWIAEPINERKDNVVDRWMLYYALFS